MLDEVFEIIVVDVVCKELVNLGLSGGRFAKLLTVAPFGYGSLA